KLLTTGGSITPLIFPPGLSAKVEGVMDAAATVPVFCTVIVNAKGPPLVGMLLPTNPGTPTGASKAKPADGGLTVMGAVDTAVVTRRLVTRESKPVAQPVKMLLPSAVAL